MLVYQLLRMGRRTWYLNIKMHLQVGDISKGITGKERKFFRIISRGYFIDGEVLYKKPFLSTLLQCVSKKESHAILYHVHEGAYEPHMNDYAIAQKSCDKDIIGNH